MTCRRQVRLSEQIIPKYWDTFNDDSIMHKIFTSGRAGTKSSRGAIKAVYKVISEPDCSVVIIRKFHNKLRKTVYKETLRAINRLGLDKKDFKITASPMEIKYLKNGNTIYFTGNDSLDDTKGMIDENKPIKLVEVDEVTEFFDRGDGEDELVNIEATFVRGNNEDFCMEYYFNPPRNPKAPVMQWAGKMEGRPDCIRIHTDYRDVPAEWLGDKLLASADQMKVSDSKMYDWLWLGECTGLEDLIYYMFDEKIHVIDPDKDMLQFVKYLVIGVDYGQMNATTFQCFGLDYKNRRLLGIDEFYHSGRESGHQMSPSDYAKEFETFKNKVEKETGKRVSFTYIDPSARGLQEEIKRLCTGVQIVGPDNTVNLGITRVQKMFSLRHLFISPKQKHLIAEMYLYEWNPDALDKGKEVPIKDHDHCMDAMRYAVMGLWRYIRMLLPEMNDKEDEEKDE